MKFQTGSCASQYENILFVINYVHMNIHILVHSECYT